jgi:hypothetical protein
VGQFEIWQGCNSTVSKNTVFSMIHIEFENPVEQIIFILGFKHDPRFRSTLDAARAGSNPGILNALDELKVYRAIYANFCAWRQMMERICGQFGPDLPLQLKEEFYEIIVNELGEKDYGGKWFPTAEVPPEHWVNLGTYSPVFRHQQRLCRRNDEVF